MLSAKNVLVKEPTPVGVLIVEDERIVAKDIEHTIRDLGYASVGIAGSCAQALSLARTTRPGLVLMDIRIQGDKDGIETAALLKLEMDVPVIFLTAHSDGTILARAAQISPHGYLLKPVRAADIGCAIAVSLVRHELETKARRRERWHASLLQSIADAVIAVDAECNVTFLNSAAESALGIPQAAALGAELRSVLRLVGESGELLDFDSVYRAVEQGTDIELPFGRLQNCETNECSHIDRSAAAVVDDGEVLGAVMVLRDVSAAREIQQRLELAERLASLGTMAAGVAHEINNPMTVVVANTSLVSHKLRTLAHKLELASIDLQKEITELHSCAEICDETLEASDRIVNIVRDLRNYSRPPSDTGAGDVYRALDWAIRSTHQLLAHCAEVVVLERVPIKPVALSDTKLGQIFVNLLSNAADAMGAGHADSNKVTIGVRMAETEVIITLSDTGTGMSERVIRRVLEPFFTTKAVGKGTGLGLAITHQIVKAVGGSFDLQSRLGVGTTITMSLPIAEPALTPEAPLDLQAAAGAARVLYIDDDEILRRMAHRMLSEHRVTVLASASEALALLAAGERFDVILCDLMMPTMTGEQFLATIEADYPELVDRVVLVTGGAIGSEGVAFLSVTKGRVLYKPFDLDTLEAMIKEVAAETQLPS